MLERRIQVPELHPKQRAIADAKARYKVAACGRRFGKTQLGIDQIIATLVDGKPAAWFSPTYKMLADVWRQFKATLAPIITDKAETEHRIETVTGGVLDMWSLENPDAGRGRKYQRVVIDEAGLIAKLEEAWTEGIRPMLTDYKGDVIFSGTPKGRNYFWRLYCMGDDPEAAGWQSWHMPTTANPMIDADEVDAARLLLPDRAYRQEYLAEFIEESGGVFRNVAESIDVGRTDNEPPQAGRSYWLGVDLARIEDFTVLTVLDDTGRQVYFERFNQVSWELQITRIEAVALRYGARTLVDSTGVGDPIFEALRKRGLNVEGIQLTSQSKEQIIDGLAIALEQSKLRLLDVQVQTNELMAYQYELTNARNIRMNAPAGMHDDTVISLALAARGLIAPAATPMIWAVG